MGFVYIIIGVLIAILGIATGAIVIKVHDKETPMFVTMPTYNELEHMRNRLEVISDEKRNAYKLVAELRDKVKELKTEHVYRVNIEYTNGRYSCYSFLWEDKFVDEIKFLINRFMMCDITVLNLHDNDKSIFIKDTEIINIVVSKEDE